MNLNPHIFYRFPDHLFENFVNIFLLLTFYIISESLSTEGYTHDQFQNDMRHAFKLIKNKYFKDKSMKEKHRQEKSVYEPDNKEN